MFVFPAGALVTTKAEKILINYNGYFKSLFEMLYFSVITIATVGYGDILPISLVSRLLCVLEIALGQFLILIAFGRAFSSGFEQIR